MAVIKSTVNFDVDGHSVEGYLAVPEAGGPGVLILHAWWGLKPFFKLLCDRLAEQGFVALAPDLNNGKLAKTVASAEKLMGQRDAEFTSRIIVAAKDRLMAQPGRAGGKIGVIGFSMGAAWSLVLAVLAPEQVAAVVLYYGAGEVDFTRVQARFLGHFARTDKWEPLEGIRAMERGMKSAGRDVKLHIYPGVAHWFVEEDRPEYDAQAAKLAWKRTLAFLKESF